jgi:hypothetical protein
VSDELAGSRTYHPLAGVAAATLRHPGTLTDCADPTCVAFERLRLELMHSEQRHAMTQTSLTAAEDRLMAVADECDRLKVELESFVEASLEECDYTSDGESGGWEPDDYERARANITEMHRVMLVRMERLFQSNDREKLLAWLHAEAVWQREQAEWAAVVSDQMRALAQYDVINKVAERDTALAERDQAIAHDRQPYPTAWAYEQACAALRRRTVERDQARADVRGLWSLVALRASAVVLPEDAEQQIASAVAQSAGSDWATYPGAHRIAASVLRRTESWRSATVEAQTPSPSSAVDREALGRKVREIWIDWASEQPNPKASWLVPWEGLSEPDKEVDRRIGEALAEFGAGGVRSPSEPDTAGAARETEGGRP